MIDLGGRIALVTGGARGIGRAAALRLADCGASVAVGYRQDVDEAEQVVASITESSGTAVALGGDLRSREEVRQMVNDTVDAFGRLDILVNVAGVGIWQDVLKVSDEEWEYQFDVNSKGTFMACQEAARAMVAGGRGGKIVNVTSISAQIVDSRLVPYCASKAAADMITRGLAVALGPYGINVNAVAPGTIPTDFNSANLRDDDVRAALIRRTPLGRLGDPKDISGAIAFLASDAADWVTGAIVVVDGGFIL